MTEALHACQKLADVSLASFRCFREHCGAYPRFREFTVPGAGEAAASLAPSCADRVYVEISAAEKVYHLAGQRRAERCLAGFTLQSSQQPPLENSGNLGFAGD